MRVIVGLNTGEKGYRYKGSGMQSIKTTLIIGISISIGTQLHSNQISLTIQHASASLQRYVCCWKRQVEQLKRSCTKTLTTGTEENRDGLQPLLSQNILPPFSFAEMTTEVHTCSSQSTCLLPPLQAAMATDELLKTSIKYYNAKDSDDALSIALMTATEKGYKTVVDLLIASHKLCDDQKYKALILADEKGHYEIAFSLIRAGAHCNDEIYIPIVRRILSNLQLNDTDLDALHNGSLAVAEVIKEHRQQCAPISLPTLSSTNVPDISASSSPEKHEETARDSSDVDWVKVSSDNSSDED